MLSFSDQKRFSRRSFLQVGALGLGGLTLPGLLAARAARAAQGQVTRDKSVVFLFLHGGPTQTETFDPKMTAPAGVRSVTGEIATKLPGVTFGSSFPRLAALADQLAIVRSFRTGDGNHDIKPIVSKQSLGANLGALYARVAGANHPRTGMPVNAALFPRAVNDTTKPANEGFGKFGATGALGAAYAPFVPGGEGQLQQAMKLNLPADRLHDRRNLLARLDAARGRAESQGLPGGLDRFQSQAFDTILGGVSDAFDLKQESPVTIARYDTEPLLRPDQISRAWNNYNNYVDNVKTLGKLLLLARRLCERGCGFVTVTTNFVWDMHADQNNATIDEGMQYMGGPLDHAVSAFLEDVKARGLADDILLVVTGEMGRTPKVNAKGGRDHWGGLTPLLLAGGGLSMGQVVGQSTRDVGEPATEPYGLGELQATIWRTLLDVGQARLQTGLPADVSRVITESQPITPLFG